MEKAYHGGNPPKRFIEASKGQRIQMSEAETPVFDGLKQPKSPPAGAFVEKIETI